MDKEELQSQDFSNKFKRYRSLLKLNEQEKPGKEVSDDDEGQAVNLVKNEIYESEDDSDSLPENENVGRKSGKTMLPTPPGSPRDSESWNSGVECLAQSGINAMSLMHGPLDHPQLLPKDDYGIYNKYYKQRPTSESGVDTNDSDPDTSGLNSTLSPYSTSASILGSGFNDSLMLSRAFGDNGSRRTRSEKKPIPEDMKDDRYFERRRRNNMAAKKSRDARKSREDKVASRASFLEHENAILQAQVMTLRDEAISLRALLDQKRTFNRR